MSERALHLEGVWIEAGDGGWLRRNANAELVRRCYELDTEPARFEGALASAQRP